MGSLWNRSGTIERYADDLRAAGAKAYFFNGGTTTPLTVYEDSGEGASHPHPVVADANGRWPDVFVPYIASYDVQVLTAADVQLTYSIEIPNLDPAAEIPPAVVVGVDTGMIHAELINSTKTGYVRLNGRTIGNAVSSATERAHPTDTLPLFTYLWNNLTDAIALVSGGRGANAAGDFAANKTITLPDFRGAAPIGLDDMGNSSLGTFTGLTFVFGSGTTPGAKIGDNSLELAVANLPGHSHSGNVDPTGNHAHTGTTTDQSVSHTHSGTVDAVAGHSHTISINDPGHFHSINADNTSSVTAGASSAYTKPFGATTTDSKSTGITASASAEGGHAHTFSTGTASVGHTHGFTTSSEGAHAHTFTSGDTGNNVPFNNLGLSVLVTWFIKL